MATSNFYNVNASKVFAVLTEDEFDYEDAVNNVKAELEKLNEAEGVYVYLGSGKDVNDNRNFSSEVLGTVNFSNDFKVENEDPIIAEFNIVCVIRSGYYQHANLDWNIEFVLNDRTFDEFDDFHSVFKELIYDYYDLDDETTETLYSEISSEIKIKSEGIIDQIEGIYKSCSTSLSVAARFSNGETWYSEDK